jgi:hypothetical protein
MARGYHVFKLKRFPRGSEFTTMDQLFLRIDGISEEEPVRSVVTRTHSSFRDGVSRYMVRHDYRERLKVPGRAKGLTFTEYVTTESFPIYVEGTDAGDSRVMIVAAKSDLAKDFVTRLSKKRGDDFIAIERQVDFAILRPKLAVISGAWFNQMQVANLSATGVFGPNVDRSDEFRRAEKHGKLSTLSTIYGYNGTPYGIQVTVHGGIVLFDSFDEDMAVELVLNIKRELLDSAWSL